MCSVLTLSLVVPAYVRTSTYLLLHLEAARGDSGAREEPREDLVRVRVRVRVGVRVRGEEARADHVYWDRPAVAHGAVCNLDVLDLGRLDQG